MRRNSNPPGVLADFIGSVYRLEYDAISRLGTLHLHEGASVDMTQAICLFLAIDPRVKAIQTFSGSASDTRYERDGHFWRSLHWTRDRCEVGSWWGFAAAPPPVRGISRTNS